MWASNAVRIVRALVIIIRGSAPAWLQAVVFGPVLAAALGRFVASYLTPQRERVAQIVADASESVADVLSAAEEAGSEPEEEEPAQPEERTS